MLLKCFTVRYCVDDIYFFSITGYYIKMENVFNFFATLWYSQKDIFFNLALLVGLSLFLHRTLSFVGQKWVETFAHTATLLLLPVVTYVLTTLISGDIALSLGMVGALSIVRFRNPVRSPFELTVYFVSITAGVAASVYWKWLVLLIFCVVGVCILLALLDYLSIKFRGKSFYSTSFTEGSHLSTLEVQFAAAGDTLGFEDFLISIDEINGQANYIFASSDKNIIRKIYSSYDDYPQLKRLQMHL